MYSEDVIKIYESENALQRGHFKLFTKQMFTAEQSMLEQRERCQAVRRRCQEWAKVPQRRKGDDGPVPQR